MTDNKDKEDSSVGKLIYEEEDEQDTFTLQKSLIKEIPIHPEDRDGGAQWLIKDSRVVYYDGINEWNQSVDEIIEMVEVKELLARLSKI